MEHVQTKLMNSELVSVWQNGGEMDDLRYTETETTPLSSKNMVCLVCLDESDSSRTQHLAYANQCLPMRPLSGSLIVGRDDERE